MSHSGPHNSKTAKRRQIEHPPETEPAVAHASIEEIAGALQALINQSTGLCRRASTTNVIK